MKPRLTWLIIALALGWGAAACSSDKAGSGSGFDFHQLFLDVFAPRPGEKVLVMLDTPRPGIADNPAWAERRQMAQDWHAVLSQYAAEMGISLHPLLTYPATGRHSGSLPEAGSMLGAEQNIAAILADSNIVLAITEFSATAPLIEFTERLPDLRAASMPMISPAMQRTALAADYAALAEDCQLLWERLDRAEGAHVEFSSGHAMYFDLRHRQAELDNGRLDGSPGSARVINLPSGEAYIAPYEGELPGQPSLTAGMLPVMMEGELVVGVVEGNRIVEVQGEGPQAWQARQYIAQEPGRQNVAELGLGCNPAAVVTGNVLEDEKVLGMHWAFGLSEHIGGTVGPEDFANPALAEHRDWVYPVGGEIFVSSLILDYTDGTSERLIVDGSYPLLARSAGLAGFLSDNALLIWLLLAASCWALVAWDLRSDPAAGWREQIGWSALALLLGPLGLALYWLRRRRAGAPQAQS